MNSEKQGRQGKYHIWGDGCFAHICFESVGCRFHKAGYCTMCNYGEGRTLSTNEAMHALKTALDSWEVPIKRLLLGTYGSIFDEHEMPRETLFALIAEIANTDVESVIFETHYTTVTAELLNAIKNRLPNKKLVVELGFESSNEEVLKNSIHKYMNLDDLKDSLSVIKGCDVHSILNVFLGAPGLTPLEQFQDSLRSMRWAFSNGADEVVVFPANVKPGTPLWHRWKSGRYVVPSSWMLVEFLSSLTDWELERTSISWYGDRQYQGLDCDIIPPSTCEQCKDRLMIFFHDFMGDFRASVRRELLKNLCADVDCRCRSDVRRVIYAKGGHL